MEAAAVLGDPLSPASYSQSIPWSVHLEAAPYPRQREASGSGHAETYLPHMSLLLFPSCSGSASHPGRSH